MRRQGRLAPNEGQTAQTGSAQDKFAVVLETAALNAADLAAYCRARGLYPEQIQAWREACEHANDAEGQSPRALKTEIQATRKRLRIVERDLARKDQALAEAAALLILRKKLQAVWGEDEDA